MYFKSYFNDDIITRLPRNNAGISLLQIYLMELKMTQNVPY